MIRIKKKKQNKTKMFVVLGIILICLLIIKGLWLSPLSNAKASERAKINIQSGAYCSGYHNNNADGTRVVVFRSKETNEVVDSFEVDWSFAEKIYMEEI